MASLWVTGHFSTVAWTAWQLLKDEHTDSQTHIHTHGALQESHRGYGALG